MLFNSIDFAIFLPLVFILYWFVFNKNLYHQNILLLISSYIFYGWWDWRFLSLILISSFLDFYIGLSVSKIDNPGKRKILLLISLFVNLGMLGFFKYYNFFIDNFIEAFSFFGKSMDPKRLNIILPVGISFYTFQTLSYTLDVYKKELNPTKNIVSFFSFVSFFPQLVAGPIERAKNLLPQFNRSRIFNYNNAIDGMRQILWGLFKKIVIADNCAIYVEDIFNNFSQYTGSTLLLGAILFAFQIYGDFSGYSDIAIGTARLFGFNLMQNFAFPYFSRDIAEFWRRWHISLSSWFRDYIYIPLGGSRVKTAKKIRNTFIIFILSGFWHGANWTFIIWGALNAIYFLPLMLFNLNRKNKNIVAKNKNFPSPIELAGMLTTFFLTCLAWIFFRSENANQGFLYISKIFSNNLFSIPHFSGIGKSLPIFIFILIFFTIEWKGRDYQYGLQNIGIVLNRYFRWGFYATLVIIIYFYSVTSSVNQFIYFQF